MKLKRSELVTALLAVGLKNSKSLNRSRLQERCKGIRKALGADDDDTPAEVIEMFEDLDEEHGKIIEALVEAADSEEEIDIVADDEKPAKGDKKAKPKKGKKPEKEEEEEEEASDDEDDEEEAPKKKKKGKKKSDGKGAGSKKDKAPRDKFGNKEGSQAAAINACFNGKTVVTVKDIAEETKLNKGRIRAHIKWLEEREHVKKSKKGDGYVTA